jgi:hypothetical protein
MDKQEAIKKAIEKRKEENADNFQSDVENLVREIELTSQRLRELKGELAELTFKEIDVPDVSDCL